MAVRCCRTALEKLRKVPAEAGWLVGVKDSSDVLSCVKATSFSKLINIEGTPVRIPDWQEESKFLATLLPVGLSVVGWYATVQSPGAPTDEDSQKWATTCMQALASVTSIDHIRVFFLLSRPSEANSDASVVPFIISPTTQNPQRVNLSIEESGANLLADLVILRFQCSAKLQFVGKDKSAVRDAAAVFRENLGSNETVFFCKDASLYFDPRSDSALLCRDVLRSPLKADGPKDKERTKKSPASQTKVVTDERPMTFTVMFKAKSDQTVAAPTLSYCDLSGGMKYVTFEIPLDVMCYVNGDQSLAEACSAAIAHLKVQLDALTSIQFLHKEQTVAPYHFLLQSLPHHITALYEAEDSALNTRRILHSRLLLPMDRPLLRTASSIDASPTPSMSSLGGKSRHLVDVHIGLPPSGVIDGKQYLVEGSYEYYHYRQDGMSDEGWGCAYRSLQTIVSWFRIQQYTQQPIPTHEAIQRALVSAHDKPPNFIGSNKWIGAFELSVCLDVLLGVQCKILNVNSGAELAEKGRELSRHFETQGTPIMIGGGVLAYTLLGIDFNEQTGDIRFLILDPHYTGPDEVGQIQAKQWCGWKGVDLFVKTAFYNLCMPQRPKGDICI